MRRKECVVADSPIVRRSDEHRISGDILRPAVQMRAGVVEVAPLLHADEVRDLRDVVDAPIEPGERSRYRGRLQRSRRFVTHQRCSPAWMSFGTHGTEKEMKLNSPGDIGLPFVPIARNNCSPIASDAAPLA